MPSHLGPLGGRAFAAVLFDMDGTLIDSIPVVIRSWLRWAQEHDLDPSRLQGFHGVPAAAIVAKLLPADRHELALQRITELELADTDGITVLPGAAEALAELSPDHCAIATSCTTPLAAVRIEATGLRVPRVVVTADDVERGKPHPDPFLLAARRLGVSAWSSRTHPEGSRRLARQAAPPSRSPRRRRPRSWWPTRSSPTWDTWRSAARTAACGCARPRSDLPGSRTHRPSRERADLPSRERADVGEGMPRHTSVLSPT